MNEREICVLVVGRKFTIFALFYFVFDGKFQVQAPRVAYIRRGDLTEVFFALRFWGGLFSEFYGITVIFQIRKCWVWSINY